MHFENYLLVYGLLLLHLEVSLVKSSSPYTITCVPPSGSNVVMDSPVTSTVNLYAGAPYVATIVTSTHALFGTTTNQVTAKLVASTNTVCDSSTVSLLGSPFDGLGKPSQLSQIFTRWGVSKFDSGGNFALCYKILSWPSVYQFLPLNIVVRGVIGTEHKIFCMFDLALECSAYLSGNEFPETPTWKLALVAFGSTDTCGVSTLLSPFENTVSEPTTYTSSVEIHSFGLLASPGTLSSYNACYCPGYQSVAIGSAMCTQLAANFIQAVGSVIIVTVSVTDPETGLPSAIYSSLKFSLSVNCGSGGCSTTTAPRIKLVDSSAANVALYHDPSAGCRAALQSQRYVAPSNCDPAVAASCALLRADATSTAPTWANLQLTNELVNGVMLQHDLDVCFCDSLCTDPANWLMVGSLGLLRLEVAFTDANAPVVSTVGIPGSISISGAESGSFRVSGIFARELKLVPDNTLSVGSSDCASSSQPEDYVSGHECYSLYDCSVPVTSSKFGLSFGSDSLVVRVAGWAAVCYCNAQCSVSSSWALIERLLFAGPDPAQVFSATAELPFTLQLTGWGLAPAGAIWLVDSIASCGAGTPTATGSVLYNTVALTGIVPAISGSYLVFASTIPELRSGDWLRISGLTSGDALIDRMMNRDHQIQLTDSGTQILLDFPSGSAPVWDFDSAVWWRSSLAEFTTMYVALPGSYHVCWGPSSALAVALAGTLTVTAPPTSVGSIGLLTTSPSVPAPVVLRFLTSSGSADTVKIVFPRLALLTPLDTSEQPLVAGSAPCALYLLESSLPLPRSCALEIDQSSGQDRVELYMNMHYLNGLAPNTEYSVVMVTEAFYGLGPVSPAAAEIWLLTTDVLQKINLFAHKSVQPSVGSLSVSLAVAPAALVSACIAESLVGACGTCVEESDCGNAFPNERTWCVSPTPTGCTAADSMEFAFTVLSGAVTSGAQIRLVLGPLLVWAIDSNPLVTSSAGTAAAIAENVLGSPIGANTIRFNLATVDFAAQLASPFSLASVALPPNGFFNQPVYFEITDTDGTNPVYGRSDGYILKKPKIQDAQIHENDISFAGDINVELILRLRLGFDANGLIEITLPPGYLCRLLGPVCDAGLDPVGCGHEGGVPFASPLFLNADGSFRVPSGRSEFAVRSGASEWSSAANVCTLTLDSVLFGTRDIYVSLLVNNPVVPLQSSDPGNVWSIVARNGAGVESAPYLLSSNAAVAAPLAAVEITPSVFSAGESNWLTVFVTTASRCMGEVWIDAPEGFDFGAVCQVDDLDDKYYFLNTPLGASSCAGRVVQGTTHNRAVIQAPAGLAENTVYGFALLVHNGVSGSAWSVQTVESGFVCDALMNFSSWQPSAGPLVDVDIAVSDWLPSSTPTSVTISVVVPVADVCVLRFTAPVGFVWTQFMSTSLPLSSWPAVPRVDPLNVLDIPYLESPLVSGATYELEAELTVPVNVPAGHSSEFYAELFTALDSVASGLIASQRIRHFESGLISYSSNLVGGANTVCMRWTIVTLVPRGGGLVIDMPWVPTSCVPLEWSGTFLPWDSTCYVSDSGVTVLAGPAGIPAATYSFCLALTNPETASAVSDWTATTYSVVSNSDSVLDAGLSVPGYPIKLLLTSGGIDLGAISNQRPLDENIVQIIMTPETAFATIIIVRAPEGFMFPRDCVVSITVASCLGVGRVATLTLLSALPVAELSFEITVASNPSETPTWNWWTVETNTHSAEPTPGFDIWTFETTSVSAIDFAAGASNEVSIRFQPRNAASSLLIVAPPGFVIPTACEAKIFGLSSTCMGAPQASNQASVALPTLVAGTDYWLVLTVTNPASPSDGVPGVWSITSYDGATSYDSSIVTGFVITETIPEYIIVAQSSLAGGDVVTIQVQFQLVAQPGETITFTAPLGYMLNGVGRKSCTGFSLATTGLRLPVPQCAGNALWWTLQVGQPLLGTETVAFSVTTTNPDRTPTVNIFSLAVASVANVVVASSTAPGSSLVPQLLNVGVAFTAGASVGAGSTSSVTVTFEAANAALTVSLAGENPRTKEVFRVPSSPISLAIEAGDLVTLEFAVVNPDSEGPSVWFVYTNVDSKNNVVGPAVLGKLSVDASVSGVVPNAYAARGAAVALYLSSSVALSDGTVLILSPPAGYVFVASSFQSIFGLFSNSDYINDLDEYCIVLGAEIRADEQFGVSLRSDLPPSTQLTENWYIRAEDDLAVATNDGLFVGFHLISLVPFTLVPENSSPSQSIFVTLAYVLPEPVVGINNVNMQVTAPVGFLFESATSCLSSKSSPYSTCIGTSNVALLTSIAKSLPPGAGAIRLLVTNPTFTPVNNVWAVELFADYDFAHLTNSDLTPGYPIKSMVAEYLGGNRLAAVVAGFFTFTLSVPPTDYFEVVITPNQPGFQFSCDPVYRVSLNYDPVCFADAANVVTFPITKSQINPDSLTYTRGVSVTNPRMPVVGGAFSILIRDVGGRVVDAAPVVTATPLKAVLISEQGLWLGAVAAKNTLSMVTVKFKFEAATVITVLSEAYTFEVTGPENYILSSKDTVVLSVGIPVTTIDPVVVKGNQINVVTNSNKPIPAGTHSVSFPVMNPSVTPTKNVWMLNVYYGTTLVYTAPIEGYRFGKQPT